MLLAQLTAKEIFNYVGWLEQVESAVDMHVDVFFVFLERIYYF